MHPYLNDIRPSGYLLQLSNLHPPFKLRKNKNNHNFRNLRKNVVYWAKNKKNEQEENN